MLIFHLENLEELPKLIYKYLGDEEGRKRIAGNGKTKAMAYHTWDVRAKAFLEEILER